jgi:hypothetical protein
MSTYIFLNHYIKAHTKGSVMRVATPAPKGKKYPKQFKNSCSLCGKYGNKFVYCYSRPKDAHKKPGSKANEKALTTTTPPFKTSITCTYCQKSGHSDKRCYKKKNDERP